MGARKLNMQISVKRFLFPILLGTITIFNGYAETSPLSSIDDGYGIAVSPYTTRERGMGEAGMANVNRSGASLVNPSRTAWNEKTSFAATFESDLDYLQDPVTSNRTTSFVMPMLAMNFQTRMPLNIGLFYQQRFHRSFSFEPLSASNPDALESIDYEGGTYEVGGNIAYAPVNWLSLAVGYHAILGRERTIDKAVFNKNSNNVQTFNAVNLEGDTTSIRSSGGYPTASMTFRQKKYSVAASASLGTTLDRSFQRSPTGLISAEVNQDYRDIPWTAAVGGAFKIKSNQTAVADFGWEAWDNAQSAKLNPAFHLGTGYEFQGSGGPYESYYRKIAYRGGLGFERLYLEETDLYFVSTGLGLPLGRRGNLFDVALKYGHRSDKQNDLWSEDFIKLTVTLTGVGVWGQPIRKRR